MDGIKYPVGIALSEVPVNVAPLIDDTDFKSREEAVTFNQAGMDLVWNFVKADGTFTQTAVTPTSAGDYDWTNQGNGMYTIEIPASGGASINNDTIGYGWFSGFATGILPWRGPVIAFGVDVLATTTIATVTSQTNITLTDGPTDANAHDGWLYLIRDATTPGQVALVVVDAYTAAKVATLEAAPTFTVAVGDYVTPIPNPDGLTVQQKADVNAEADQAIADYFGSQISDSVNDAGASANTFQVTTSQGTNVLVGILRFTSGALAGEARLVHWTGTTIETADLDSIPAGLEEVGPFSAAPANSVTFVFNPLS